MRLLSRTRIIALGLGACLAAAPPVLAQSPSPAVPTPSTPGPNPGQAATDAVTNPARPPAEVAPPTGTPVPGAPPSGSLPGAPVPGAAPPSGRVQYAPPPPAGPGDLREVVDLMRAAAAAARESVDYQRVVPDILTQILAKLDKIEDKLDKVENAVKAGGARRR